MKKVFLTFLFFAIQFQLFSQLLDFNVTYKSAMELYNRGNYAGAKVRFVIAQRKADKERNYSGRQQASDYADKSAECTQLIKDGDRTFSIGEYEIAKKYYERIAELNPKDPSSLDRTLKCRNETDYLDSKKQADAFFLNNDWSQANVLYNVCLDSSKMHLNSYKRYESEVQKRNQECIRQLNIFNPDSVKLKLKNLKDKLKKKIKSDEKKPEGTGKESHGFLWQKDFFENLFMPNRQPFLINNGRKKINNITNWSVA